MKHFLYSILCTLILIAPTSVSAIITYGQSNSDAAVDYESADNAALTSVVGLGNGSAVHLGNGWFLTANHVSANINSTISQNGASSAISYVDNTLKSTFGTDLKLFYVDDFQSLTNLTSVNISTNANESLSLTTFGYKRSFSFAERFTYTLTYTSGSQLTLAGAGFGRNETSSLTDETVASDGIKGIVHSGISTLMSTQTVNGVTSLITMAETKTGSAQAQDGDSGSGMFVYFENEWYIVGTVTSVYPSISTAKAIFGSFDEASLTYNESGTPNGFDNSALLENSLTVAIDLSDYIGTISSIIATNPLVPEPAQTTTLIGISAFVYIFWLRRKK